MVFWHFFFLILNVSPQNVNMCAHVNRFFAFSQKKKKLYIASISDNIFPIFGSNLKI